MIMLLLNESMEFLVASDQYIYLPDFGHSFYRSLSYNFMLTFRETQFSLDVDLTHFIDTFSTCMSATEVNWGLVWCCVEIKYSLQMNF